MILWLLIRKLLFLLPAEFTHEIAKISLKIYARLNFLHQTYPTLAKATQANFLGVMNPIGLAAGFDKNAEILTALPSLGFGYAEIGTVTPKPQGGNPKPRLFRDPKNKALFNRMGFNNLGAGIVSARLRKAKPHLPATFKVGVNLGKNKNTPDSEAASDYAKVARAFLDCADYFVINVSSPNTPGLRALQTEEALIPIIQAVQNELLVENVKIAQSSYKKIPILVKLAPEMTGDPLLNLVRAMEKQNIDGLVLTNTLGSVYIYREESLSGGLSGQILTSESRNRLEEVRKVTSLPIISVGGIDSAEEMQTRFDLGADLIQIYTAWIYEGPFFIRKLARYLNGQ